MKFGLWSNSPDWKLAREINRNSWSIRRNATIPEEINRELERVLKRAFPKEEKKIKKTLKKIHNQIRDGIERYKNDFSNLEEIKHSTEILETERIKKINDFEHLIKWLRREKKLDDIHASYFLRDIDKIKHKLRSDIGRDRGRETRLKWMSF